MASIQDLTEAWAGHDGLEVEEFIKSQINSTIASLLGKFGAVSFDSENMRLTFFDQEGGVQLGSVSLGGDVYTIAVDSNVEQVFYVLADETSKNITITPSTTVSPFGSTTQNPYPEAYSYTVAVNTGTGYVSRITGNVPVGGSATFDIRPFLATGDNYIRLSVTGEASRQTRTIVYTATLTSLSLACNHSWQDVWVQGHDYVLNGIRFVGSLQKTLHVAIDGVEVGTVQYASSDSYWSTATTYTIDSDEFIFETSGVHAISLWMTASGVSTPVISYNIMCAASGDMTPMVTMNALTSSAVNYTSGKLFSYAVYNADKVQFDLAATLNSVVYPVAQGVTVLNVEAGFQYDFAYSLEVDTGANETKIGTIAFSSTAYFESTQGNTFAASTVFDNTYSYIASPGALFYLNAATRSNYTNDHELIVNEMGASENFAASYAATWNGFSFSSDAWATDPSGNKALVIPAGSDLNIPTLRPLQFLSAYDGMTVELMLQTANPSDYDTPVLTLVDNDLGVYIYPTKIVIFGSNEHDEVSQSIVLDENRMTHLAITFTKNYGGVPNRNLCSIYVNGISNVNFAFEGNSVFGNGNLFIGQNDTDVFLYKMRVYGRSLESTAVFNNFLNCIIDGVEFSRRIEWNRNAITDNNTIDYDLCKAAGYNIMVVTMDDDSHPLPSVNNATSYSGCSMRFEYAADSRYNVEVSNVDLDGQGTTSKKYYRWNLRAKTTDNTVWAYGDGSRAQGKVGKFINLNTYAPVDRITAKKNYASSMQGHKMGMTGLYNDLFKEIGLGAELPDAEYRVAVYQFPFVGFLYHSSNNTYEYIGLYTAGPDKGSKVTFGYDKNTHPDLLAIEGPNHDPAGTRFLTPWVDVTYDSNEETLMFGGEEGWDCRFISGYSSDKAADAAGILARYTSEWKPAYNCVFNNSPYIVSASELIAGLNNPSITTISALTTVANAGIIREGTTNGYRNELLCFYDDITSNDKYELYFYRRLTGRFERLGTVDPQSEHNVRTALSGYLSTNTPTTAQIVDARAARFKATFGNFFSVLQTIFHYAYCVFFGVTDNFAKNTYPRKFKALSSSAAGNRWGWDQDDLDTVLATDNNGRSTKKYSVEHGDLNASGVEVFQGGNSALWVLIRNNYGEEIKSMMQSIVRAASNIALQKGISGTSAHTTFFNVVSNYCWEQSAKYFSAVLYEKDKEWSYLPPWLEDPTAQYNNVYPLDQALGDQYQAERIWVERRIAYMFSKFRLGAFSGTDTTDYHGIAITLARQFEFNLTPAIDLYPVVSVASTDYPLSSPTRTSSGNIKQVLVPAGGASNNYIHGVDWLASLGDLSHMVLTDRGADTNISFSVQAARLQTLKIGDENPNNVEFNATSFSVKSPTLTYLDGRNTTTIRNNIDLLNCPRLQTILFEGSNASGLLLPVGARLQEVSFPAAATTVFMHSLPFLTEENLTLPVLSDITTLYVNNCKYISPLAVLDDIMSTGEDSLDYVTLIWRGELTTTASELNALSGIVDKTGYVNYSDNAITVEAGMPYVEGILNYNGSMDINQYYRIINNFENLTLNVDETKVYIDFEDAEVERIALANWDTDSSGFISMGEVLAVTNITNLFYNNTTIETFDEFQYFTNVPSLSPQNLDTQGFSGCTNLTSIVLPKSLRMLGQSSFRNCSSLTSVNLENVTELYNYVFQGCTNLEIDVNMPYLTRLNDTAFINSGITSVTSLGNTITSIQGGSGSGNGTFRGCVKLESVNLPSSVTEIGQNAFNGCTNLETINLSSSILTIGAGAFQNCTNIEINVNLPNLVTLGNNAFYGSGIKKVLSLGNITTIPGGTNGSGAFQNCTRLESVKTTTKLTDISGYAFYGCSALSEIDLSEVTTIGNAAFYGALSGYELNAPNLETLGQQAFRTSGLTKIANLGRVTTLTADSSGSNGGLFARCTSLTEVTLPATLTTINRYAFYSCSALEKVTILATTPPSLANTDAFSGASVSLKFYVPDTSIADYQRATNWRTYKSQIFGINGGQVTYNYGTVTSGYYLKNNDSQAADANYSISDYISVTPGHSLSFSLGIVNGTACLNTYTSSKAFSDYWGGNATPRTFTLGADEVYVRLSILNSAMAMGEAYVFDNTAGKLLYPTAIVTYPNNDN